MSDEQIKTKIEKILDDCEDIDPDTMHTYALKSKAVDEILYLIASLRRQEMIKPILKIEAPSTLSEEYFDKMNASLQDAELTKEYHVLLVTGNTDYFSFEIITAKDASLHKP